VGERHVPIGACVPDHDRHRDLLQPEAPRPDECDAVLEAPLHAGAHRLADGGGQVLGELAGQHGPVHVRERRLEPRDNIGGGGILELFALVEEVWPQLVFTVEGRGKLGDRCL